MDFLITGKVLQFIYFMEYLAGKRILYIFAIDNGKKESLFENNTPVRDKKY